MKDCVYTNHNIVHYANEELCLYQSQVFCWVFSLPPPLSEVVVRVMALSVLLGQRTFQKSAYNKGLTVL
jgi:hypothetical protein